MPWGWRMTKTWLSGVNSRQRDPKQWSPLEILVGSVLEEVTIIICSAPLVQHPSIKDAPHRDTCTFLCIFQFLIHCSVEFGHLASLFLNTAQVIFLSTIAHGSASEKDIDRMFQTSRKLLLEKFNWLDKNLAIIKDLWNSILWNVFEIC